MAKILIYNQNTNRMEYFIEEEMETSLQRVEKTNIFDINLIIC